MFHNTSIQAHERVTVRQAHVGDELALARLAALDSSDAPVGPTLVAESESRILAALPLGRGPAIADPFVYTAELLALLELRREQLEREQAGSGRRLTRRMRGLARLRLSS